MIERILEQNKQFIKKHRNKKWFWPFIIIGVGLFLFFLLLVSKRESKPKPPEEQAWPVKIQTVQLGAFQPQVVLFGKTESPNTAKMTATIEAYVQSLEVQEGDFVRSGQLLIKLDQQDVALVLAQRQAVVEDLIAKIDSEQLTYLADQKTLEAEERLVELKERALSREKSLQAKKLNAQAQLDQAEIALATQRQSLIAKRLSLDNHKNRLAQLNAQLDNARAQLSQAKLDMSRTQIHAPFNGWVTKVPVSVGERTRLGQEIIHLFDIEQYEIRAQIPFKYLAQIKSCLSKQIISCQQSSMLQAHTQIDGQVFTLYLARISGEIDQNKGGVEGLFHFEKIPSYLPIGRSIKLVLNLPQQEQLAEIPSQALYGNERIYLLENERMKPMLVDVVGERMVSDELTSRVLVFSQDLKNGQTLITTQLPNAIQGLKVKVVKNGNRADAK